MNQNPALHTALVSTMQRTDPTVTDPAKLADHLIACDAYRLRDGRLVPGRPEGIRNARVACAGLADLVTREALLNGPAPATHQNPSERANEILASLGTTWEDSWGTDDESPFVRAARAAAEEGS